MSFHSDPPWPDPPAGGYTPARPPDLAALLAHAARVAAATRAAAVEDLRTAVVEFVRHRKADGLPPERVLVAVKAAAGVGARPDSADGARAALAADVVRWCIAAYYDVPEAADRAD